MQQKPPAINIFHVPEVYLLDNFIIAMFVNIIILKSIMMEQFINVQHEDIQMIILSVNY